jgi:hypothetical protein
VLGLALGDQQIALAAPLGEQAFRLVLGGEDDLVRVDLGLGEQLVALAAGGAQDLLAAVPRRGEQLVALPPGTAGEPLGLRLGLLEDLGALLDDRAGRLDVLGQRLTEVVEQIEQELDMGTLRAFSMTVVSSSTVS